MVKIIFYLTLKLYRNQNTLIRQSAMYSNRTYNMIYNNKVAYNVIVVRF